MPDQNTQATSPQPQPQSQSPGSVIVVGAGLSGWRTARDLRTAGFSGPVLVVGDEEPYDRPPLSKQYLSGEYDDARISLLRGDEPGSIDVEVREGRVAAVRSGGVTLDDGTELTADAVVVATGSRAARPRLLDGHDAVRTLRTREDARDLREALSSASSLLVLGGGFIGAELASAARDRGIDVTVVEMQPVLFAGALGEDVGARVEALHREAGVRLHTGVAVDHLLSDDGSVTAVLSDGARMSADVVVAGFGATLNTEPLADAGLELTDGVVCDEVGRVVGLEGVYAVGDIAAWHDPLVGRPVRREHWSTSGDQAAVVAKVIAGQDVAPPVAKPPYFWSDQLGLKIQVFGRPDLADAAGWIEADDLEPQSVWAHRRGDLLVGVTTIGIPRLLGRFRAEVTAALAAVAEG